MRSGIWSDFKVWNLFPQLTCVQKQLAWSTKRVMLIDTMARGNSWCVLVDRAYRRPALEGECWWRQESCARACVYVCANIYVSVCALCVCVCVSLFIIVFTCVHVKCRRATKVMRLLLWDGKKLQVTSKECILAGIWAQDLQGAAKDRLFEVKVLRGPTFLNVFAYWTLRGT